MSAVFCSAAEKRYWRLSVDVTVVLPTFCQVLRQEESSLGKLEMRFSSREETNAPFTTEFPEYLTDLLLQWCEASTPHSLFGQLSRNEEHSNGNFLVCHWRQGDTNTAIWKPCQPWAPHHLPTVITPALNAGWKRWLFIHPEIPPKSMNKSGSYLLWHQMGGLQPGSWSVL